MRKLIFLTLCFLSCKDQDSKETVFFRRQKIDNLIQSKSRKFKQCFEDSSFEHKAIGRFDTTIRTFFCDTSGELYMIRQITYFPTHEALYLCYFNRGKIIKVEEEYPARNYSPPIYHSDFYIDDDTTFYKKQSEASYSDMKRWTSIFNADYNFLDSVKGKK